MKKNVRTVKNKPGRLESCEGKKEFASWIEAERTIRFRRRRDGDFKAPYRCRFCHNWHIGTNHK